MSALKKTSGDLQSYVSSVQSQSAADIETQKKAMADFQSKTNMTLGQQNDNITKIQNTATSVQNIVVTLNTALDNLKQSLNDYVNKVEIKNYATKTDLQATNTLFNSYLSKTDFTTFKNNLPDYPTRQEMNVLVTSFITKSDISNINATIASAEKAIAEVTGVVTNMKDTYATKNDLLKITGDTSQGTVNIQSLYIALDGVKNNLKTMQDNITAANAALTDYKTLVGTTYVSKAELDQRLKTITDSLSSIAGNTSSIVDNITVMKKLTVNGDILMNDIKISKNFTNFADASKSEIANDIDQHKKLMLVGNRSSGVERRVGVMDRLDVLGSMGVQTTADAQNIIARDSVKLGEKGDKGWIKSDGAAYVGGRLGVGVSTDDAVFNSGKKQFVARGGAVDDWQVGYINPNGNRSVYFNHGDGHGINVNTGDTRGDRMGLNIQNGQKQVLGAYNDGNINVDGTVRVQKADPGPMLEKNYGANDFRYGMGQWPNGVVRTYSGSRTGSVNMSVAKADGSFDDIVKASVDNVQMNKDLRVNANNVCLQDQCLTSTDFQKVKAGQTSSTSTNAFDKSVDNWKATADGANRFYFANAGRTYFGSKNGYEWRDAGDQVIKSINNDGGQFAWGKNAGDWNWRQYNPNGGNVHMNHGGGYGMHINTNNREAAKYALELHNGARTLMQVKNDGQIVQMRKDGRATHFDYDDNRNYIRGDTVVNGHLTVTGAKIINDWDINGQWIYANGFVQAPAFRNTSDERLKTNIQSVNTSDTANFNKLQPKSFKWKEGADDNKQYGFIAQDVEKVYPNLVQSDDKGMKNVNYMGFIPLMTDKLNKNLPSSDKLCLDDVCITKEELLKLKSKI